MAREVGTAREVRLLPKAHLHLHFTGSMRPGTLLELADLHGVHLPEALTSGEPPQLRATDERGWFRFQRLYDIARSCLRTAEDIQRLVREAAEEDRADGSGWLEIQVDPTSYAPRLGGLIPTHGDHPGRGAGRLPGHRRRHGRGGRREPDEAPAGRPYAGPARGALRRPGCGRLRPVQRRTAGPGTGLRPRLRHRQGRRAARRPARRRAGRARPASATAWTTCTPSGSGTGCAPPRTPTCCAGSPTPASPARSAPPRTSRWASTTRPRTCRCGRCGTRASRWRWAPTTRCCSAPGWPRSTRSRGTPHGFTDEELAELARQSLRASRAPREVKERLLAGVDGWLA